MSAEGVTVHYKSKAATAKTAALCFIYAGLVFSTLALFLPLFLQPATWFRTVLQAIGLTPSAFFWMSRIGCSYLAMALFAALVHFTASPLRDVEIHIGSDGIRLPFEFFLSMKGRTQRLWTDIAHIGTPVRGKEIVLSFRSGGQARLLLDCIDRCQLEQLLLSLDIRATAATKDSGLSLLLNALLEEKRNNGELSYTRLWEMDMNHRFSPVSFIPLQPGQKLGGGRIEIVEQLGFGGLSAIYLGQLSAGEFVVVKETIVPDRYKGRSACKSRELAQREASLLMTLSHQQIVRAIDFFEEEVRGQSISLRRNNRRQSMPDRAPARRMRAPWLLRSMCCPFM